MRFLVLFLQLAFSVIGSFVQGSLIPKGSRIIGGETAPDGAVPYMAQLVDIDIDYNYDIIFHHLCGGCILNKRWVLSAAHCIVDRIEESIKVLVGTNLDGKGGTKHDLETYINHDEWNNEMKKNDISLIKVAQDFEFNDRVQPIKLPSQDTEAGALLLVAGWGRMSMDPEDTPDELQWLNVTSVDTMECKKRFSELGFDKFITETNVCAINTRGKGACYGDSGGPLAEGDAVVGVVSWGKPCALGYPDVYTRVFKFRDWILAKIRQVN